MSALLSGMELVAIASSRLKVHTQYLDRLPSTFATRNFQSAVIEIHAAVLRFPALVISKFQQSRARRAFSAFRQTSEIVSFEQGIRQVESLAETEANICQRELTMRDQDNNEQWKLDLKITLKGLDSFPSIQTSIDQLRVKADLANLAAVWASGATHHSNADPKSGMCLEGTRSDLLAQITDWTASGPPELSMFWLYGKAGTGKSTISRTIADNLQTHRHLAGYGWKEATRRPSIAFASLEKEACSNFPTLCPASVTLLRPR